MKRIKSLALACVAALTFFGIGSQSAQAGSPLRFGVKAGVNINSLKFDNSLISSSNREGFTGGLNLQFSAPIIGIGVDASVMYTHRQNRLNQAVSGWTDADGAYIATEMAATTVNADYIQVPILARWNIGLPVVGKFVSPFIATGPDFSFLMSKKNVKDAIKNKAFDVAWDFAVGLRIIDHLEVAASYGLGISNAASGADAMHDTGIGQLFNGKNRFWTVTACWLF